MAYLTDETLKTTGFKKNNLLHIVDVDDTSQNPAGSSFKAEAGNFINSQVINIPTPVLGMWKDYSSKSKSKRFFVQFDVKNPCHKRFLELNPKLILGYRKNVRSNSNATTNQKQTKKTKIVFPYRGIDGQFNGNIEFKNNFIFKDIATGLSESLSSNMNWYMKSSPTANEIKIPANFHDKIILEDLPIHRFFHTFIETAPDVFEKVSVPFDTDLDVFLDYLGNPLPLGYNQNSIIKTLRTGKTRKNQTYSFYCKFVCDNPEYDNNYADNVQPILEGALSNKLQVFARYNLGQYYGGGDKKAFILSAI